jgi:shikimate kinase
MKMGTIASPHRYDELRHRARRYPRLLAPFRRHEATTIIRPSLVWSHAGELMLSGWPSRDPIRDGPRPVESPPAEGANHHEDGLEFQAQPRLAQSSSNVARCACSSLASVVSARPLLAHNWLGSLNVGFSILDVETERFFGTSIERLRNRHLTSDDFRIAASQVLKHVLSRDDSCNCVIALPPSGLLGDYWKVINDTRDAIIVVLRDTPENILSRITFYDIDSRPVQKDLTDREKGLYVREIRRDMAYFGRSFRKAHVSVDITGSNPDEASRKVRDALTPPPLKDESEALERGSARTHIPA